MVRRTAAHNLGLIADVSEGDFIMNSLVPLWVSLIKDLTDSVKVKAIEVAPKFMNKLDKQ